MNRSQLRVRNAVVVARALAGETQQSIAQDYGITRQAVSLITKRAGIHRGAPRRAAIARRPRTHRLRVLRQNTHGHIQSYNQRDCRCPDCKQANLHRITHVGSRASGRVRIDRSPCFLCDRLKWRGD